MDFIQGTVIQGHRVASGLAEDNPFADATLSMQKRYFLEAGIDLNQYFLGTVNISIAPLTFEIVQPKVTVADLKWSPDHEPETFHFADCWLSWQDKQYEGLIYYPDPSTKIGHFKDPSVLEVLAPKLEGLKYGQSIEIAVDDTSIRIER